MNTGMLIMNYIWKYEDDKDEKKSCKIDLLNDPNFNPDSKNGSIIVGKP